MDQIAPPSGRVALPALRGHRVILRMPDPADVAVRVAIPRDPEEHRMYGGSGEPKVFTADEVRTIFSGYVGQDLAKARAFIVAALAWPDGRPVDRPEGRYIGTARLHGISREDRKARLVIGVFDRRFWSQGYGSEAIGLLLAYGFDVVGLHRIDLRVLAYNARAIRAYEKCGFVREGVERESAFVDGRWHDDVIMAILEHEYQAQSRR